MTPRELINVVLKDEKPLVKLMGALQLLRSVVHSRTESFDGCVVGFTIWISHYKEVSEETIQQWLTDMGAVADLNIPDDIVAMAVREGEPYFQIRLDIFTAKSLDDSRMWEWFEPRLQALILSFENQFEAEVKMSANMK